MFKLILGVFTRRRPAPPAQIEWVTAEMTMRVPTSKEQSIARSEMDTLFQSLLGHPMPVSLGLEGAERMLRQAAGDDAVNRRLDRLRRARFKGCHDHRLMRS